MSEEQTEKQSRTSAEDFVRAFNNPQVKSIEEVATQLNLKPASVKARMNSLKTEYGIAFRELPFRNSTTSTRSLKGNTERIEQLRRLAQETMESES